MGGQRTLAATIRPYQREELPLCDAQVYLAQGHQPTWIAVAQALYLYDRTRGCWPLSRP